jgi:hypothetical protein
MEVGNQGYEENVKKGRRSEYIRIMLLKSTWNSRMSSCQCRQKLFSILCNPIIVLTFDARSHVMEPPLAVKAVVMSTKGGSYSGVEGQLPPTTSPVAGDYQLSIVDHGRYLRSLMSR